ncbi:hypothetical protein [Tropicibacter oceani]|uniref:Sel1 repeat family protein n=1 Tax=Tropicibacter oceani TaxID=3058420 RepID=A0ABY8QEX8_9RHOB|nr:hypothetical protein [Tropicibacter oceani]WGW02553.1 hypothetical protein QF118_11415 [Tropicibacter oceani]
MKVPLLAACLLLIALAQGAMAQDIRLQRRACQTLEAVDWRVDPVAMYSIALGCVRKGRFDDAIGYMTIGGAQMHFDAQRVLDPSAGAVNGALNHAFYVALSKKQRTILGQAFERAQQGGLFEARLCALLNGVKAPLHDPGYMIRHGLWQFTQPQAKPLKPDFRAKAAWRKTRRSFMQCT